VRPRGLPGVVRSRLPLAAQLFLAGRAGWLYWRGPDRFALLEPPAGRRPETAGGRRLRLLNRYWDTVALVGSLVGVLVVAAPLFLVPNALVQLAVRWLYIGVGTVCFAVAVLIVLRTLWVLYGLVEPSRWDQGRSTTDAYLSEHWSVPLCHVENDRAVGDTLKALQGWADIVLIRESGVTAPDGLAAVRAAATSVGAPDSGLLVLRRQPRREVPVPDPRPGGGVAVLLLVAVAIPFVLGGTLAGWERAVCGRRVCSGQPATYGRAVYWMFSEYLWTNPPGLTPLSTQGRILAPEARLFSAVVVLVFGVTVVRYLRWQKRVQKMSAMSTAVPNTTLVLVASTVERDAVIGRVGRCNGMTAPERTFAEHHTIFDLGPVAGSRVLLAQSEQGIESPGAMMLTANDLIVECAPDHVVLVGTCVGLREAEQRIGDVVVPTQLRNLNWKAVVREAAGATAEFIRGDRVSPGVLLDRCRAATSDWSGRVHFGTLLSENVLVESADHARLLAEREPDALAVEMEGAGVYAAAARSKVDWIMIKGVAGWGQHAPEPAQVAGAESAADFLVHLLGTGALGQAEPESSGRPVPAPGPRAGADSRPRVFVSYANTPPEHSTQVLLFARFLVDNGVDVVLDVWADRVGLDWSLWAVEQYRDSDFVLVVASPEYRRRAEGAVDAPTEGRGVQYEAAILREEYFRDRAAARRKVLVVVLPGRSLTEAPRFVQPHSVTHYVVTAFTPDGAEDLLRALTGQPAHQRPPLGRLPVLPPRD
jgi:nucleoside phosphorylase